jgi:hypothetical protein
MEKQETIRSKRVRVEEVLVITSGNVLGRDYDAEMVVNSEGDYIYRCYCGSSLFGNLENISMQNLNINCDSCGLGIPAYAFVKKKREGPRVYRINRIE